MFIQSSKYVSNIIIYVTTDVSLPVHRKLSEHLKIIGSHTNQFPDCDHVLRP